MARTGFAVGYPLTPVVADSVYAPGDPVTERLGKVATPDASVAATLVPDANDGEPPGVDAKPSVIVFPVNALAGVPCTLTGPPTTPMDSAFCGCCTNCREHVSDCVGLVGGLPTTRLNSLSS